MRLLLALFLLAGCTSALKSGDSEPSTLFVVEGLGYGDYVSNGLAYPLQAKVGAKKFNFVRIAWGSECPQNFPPGRLVAVGHSLGGPRVLECVKASGREWDLVITLDARVLGQPYSAPANAKRTVNFMQQSILFPGYPVLGAEEHIVNAGHTELPYLPQVHSLVEGAL